MNDANRCIGQIATDPSADVLAEAEDHAVTIARRGGEPLVLMSQRPVPVSR